MEGETKSVRLGGFDMLRCGAALAVVLLHASAPYLSHPMPGLTWPVFDTPSVAADWIGWSIELWVMPLFLMIAGLFVPPLWQRMGDWQFIRHRAVRLLVPLLVASIIILPADLYIWLTGWLIEGHIVPRKLRSLKFDAGVDDGLWGLSHLWFLHYLFLYSAAWVLCRRLLDRIHWQRWQPRLALNVIGLAAFAWLTLTLVPQVVFGFQHAFLPVPSKWIYSGTYFVGGILLAQNEIFLRWTKRHAAPLLGAGAVATMIGVWLGHQWLDGTASMSIRIAACGAAVGAAWCVSLGSVGAASRCPWPTGRGLRYAAAASFWVYLIHHPIVALAHIQLKVIAPELASPIKILVAATLAVVFSLLSFEVLIRRPPLAHWMGTPAEFIKAAQPEDVQPAASGRAATMPGSQAA